MKFPENWLASDSLGELISSELRLQIINGEIEDGAVLTENMVSKSFETSRSPVREAFKTLELEGLVTPGRMGITVQGLNEESIKEIYDVRFLLEGFSIREILENFDTAQASEFYKITDLMKLHANHNDFIEFAYQDLLFHETLIMHANHKRVTYFWNSIRNIILCLLLIATEKRFKEDSQELENLISRHRILIDALVEKDQNKIEKWLENHLLDTNATVMNAYLKK